MNSKIIAIVFFVTMCIIGTMCLQYKKETIQLKEGIRFLTEKNKQLKEKFALCETTCVEPICHAGADYQGDVRYIDCGDSFAERWATCLCTTMCLQDFTITVTNSERCRNWPSVPIQVRPEPEETTDDDEE